MREFNKHNLSQVSGGASSPSETYVKHNDNGSLEGSVIVVPSANGQVAHITIEIVEMEAPK